VAGLRSGYVVAGRGRVAANVADVNAKTHQERLKAALRENLKRRKAQARGRRDAGQDSAPSAPGDPAAEREPTK
jgi:hypothetical protein